MILVSLLLAISMAGLVLVALLFIRLREVDRTRQLKRYRSREMGVADMLNYAAVVAPGVVLGKNGVLLAGWQYTAEDISSMEDPQRDSVSVRINQALSRLGSGWTLHVDAVRRAIDPYAGQWSTFPDTVSQAIDDERREFLAGTAYATTFFLCVSYRPPAGAAKRLSEIIYHDNQKVDARADAVNTLANFEKELTNIEDRLSSVVSLRRLLPRTEDGVIYDELLSHLQYCATGIHQPIRLPRTPIYLDAVIGGQEMYGGVLPRIGRNYLQIVAVEGFPAESYSGMLTALGELGLNYRWSTRFSFLESWEALSHLDKFRKRWKTLTIPFLSQVFNFKTDNINEDAMSMVVDATSASTAISGGWVGAGHFTANVVIYGEERDAVERNSRTVEKLINNLGFAARTETINTMDAWLGSLPGHSVENVRRPMINTLNLADLLPVSSVWTGSATAPCPLYPEGSSPLSHVVTTGDTAFNLNLHVSDVGSTFCVGPTGSGKSTLLAFLVAQLRRYKGMTVFAFDRGMSMYTYCVAAGGTHYSVGDDMAFCPLQYLATPPDRAWASEWIAQICAMNGLETTPLQRNQITGAIQNMHACNHTTLTDFCCSVRDLSIQDALREYTVAGSHPTLFDSAEDTLDLDVFTVFEVEELMGMDPKFGLPTLLYIFRRLERSIHNRARRGEPSCIILDEAWLMLGHPVFREKIKDWLRTMRKANCAVVMATQSLSDAINSGILDIVKDSTATKIFLPNPSARDVDGGALYQRFGLNEREIEAIANATPKREYMVRTDEHCRLIDLVLGPLALAFVGVSDKESVAEVKRCQQQFGKEWLDEWLRRRGVNKRIQRIDNEEVVCS